MGDVVGAISAVFPTFAAGTTAAAGATGIPQYFINKRAGDIAASKQEQANRVSKAGAAVEAARRRRQAIAQARIAQAQNIANQSSAVQNSSSLSGVQSSLATTLGANLGNQTRDIGNQQSIFNLQQDAADALRKGRELSSLFTAAGDTAKLGFQLFG